MKNFPGRTTFQNVCNLMQLGVAGNGNHTPERPVTWQPVVRRWRWAPYALWNTLRTRRVNAHTSPFGPQPWSMALCRAVCAEDVTTDPSGTAEDMQPRLRETVPQMRYPGKRTPQDPPAPRAGDSVRSVELDQKALCHILGAHEHAHADKFPGIPDEVDWKQFRKKDYLFVICRHSDNWHDSFPHTPCTTAKMNQLGWKSPPRAF